MIPRSAVSRRPPIDSVDHGRAPGQGGHRDSRRLPGRHQGHGQSTEDGDLSAFVLQAMLENWEAAKEDRRPMCADTGVPRWYVKAGNEASLEGRLRSARAALSRATAQGHQRRPAAAEPGASLVAPDHDNNVGMNAPEIEYTASSLEADWLDITTVHKGGLFGTDYRMLFPGDGIDGIKRFFLDTLVAFGKRGLACQPAIVGIGLAAPRTPAWCWASRRPACARSATATRIRRSPKLELELKELGNSIGMGADGFRRFLHGGRLPHRGGYTATPAACRCRCTPSACRRAAPWRALTPTARSRTAPTRNWFTPYHATGDGRMAERHSEKSAQEKSA